MFWLATNIPLLAEEGWLRGQSRSREATFSRADGVVSSARLISLAGPTTPSAPSLRSAHPPLLCEEGNTSLSCASGAVCLHSLRSNSSRHLWVLGTPIRQLQHSRSVSYRAGGGSAQPTPARPRGHSLVHQCGCARSDGRSRTVGYSTEPYRYCRCCQITVVREVHLYGWTQSP